MVSFFFVHKELPSYINDTSIVLVPKKENPTLTKDYRPIALCNVAYKVISKIIATRLRSVIQKIISQNQAAFVKGRCIAENTMIAREILHSFSRKKGKRGFMMIKLDMEKAYDRMEWSFLLNVLNHIGFTSPFTEWVQDCISVKQIRLLLNGAVVGKFKPERGIRQGDLLSPTLFIIAAETLSRLLQLNEEKGRIKGFQMGRQEVKVNHLMFADDVIIFGQATIKEAKAFRECLDLYCQWSGQKINIQKSSIYFSIGVQRDKVQAISQYWGMRKMTPDTIYLGLPLFRSSKRTEDYKPIVDKVLNRVQGWKAKMLSCAGRASLIKSVGTTLANYVASSDVLPKPTAHRIDKTLRDFWWGDSKDKRVIHPVAWDTLCRPKTHGGLGFRSMESINKAFLMKWVWRVLEDDASLWKQVMEAKYGKSTSFLDLETQPKDSPIWKAILLARHDMMGGLCRKIGNGETTSIWFHPWVLGPVPQPQPRLDATEGVSLVNNFIDNNSWNEEMVRTWFQPEDARRILNITLPNSPTRDSLLWLPEENGKYSIKSAYRTIKTLHDTQSQNTKWRRIWGTTMHNRLKMVWWRILADCLLTRGKLMFIFNLNDTSCPLCSLQVEYSFHIIWECEVARALWFGSIWNIRTSESDSKGAIEAITTDHSKIKDLNHNIQPLVQRFHTIAHRVELWEATWVPRSLNGVADFVAHWAIQSGQFGTIELTNFVSSLPTWEADG
uniref:Reverse transcriptase domain-containing protein n=1 Tax=Cannabis sativa TaxID=3483 RepID=A0A803PC68_CANSA